MYFPAAALAPCADKAQVPGIRPIVETTAKIQKGIELRVAMRLQHDLGHGKLFS